MAKLDLEIAKVFDKSDMLGLLNSFPGQLREAKQIVSSGSIKFKKRDFSSIVFAGLGGSAIGADLVRSYLYFQIKLPVIVCREYDLPGFVDSSTLVFICSYSGNTEETLSAYQQAIKAKAEIIVISSGGKLIELAKAAAITYIEIPKMLPPRAALGYSSIVPLSILANLNLIAGIDDDLERTTLLLEELRDNLLSINIAKDKNIAKQIAEELIGKLAVIYSGSIHFDVAAIRLRGQLNENAKTLAASHFFPEMNHNEIVGWRNPQKLFKDFVVLMLKDKGLHPRIQKRMEISSAMIKKEGVKIIEVNSRGECLLSRIFSLVYIGDFISYYLALCYEEDPTPVESVTYLKEQLKKSIVDSA